MIRLQTHDYLMFGDLKWFYNYSKSGTLVQVILPRFLIGSFEK